MEESEAKSSPFVRGGRDESVSMRIGRFSAINLLESEL